MITRQLLAEGIRLSAQLATAIRRATVNRPQWTWPARPRPSTMAIALVFVAALSTYSACGRRPRTPTRPAGPEADRHRAREAERDHLADHVDPVADGSVSPRTARARVDDVRAVADRPDDLAHDRRAVGSGAPEPTGPTGRPGRAVEDSDTGSRVGAVRRSLTREAMPPSASGSPGSVDALDRRCAPIEGPDSRTDSRTKLCRTS